MGEKAKQEFLQISIHTALAGCDYDVLVYNGELNLISIHTALAGCDLLLILQRLTPNDFNPHSPRRL